MQDMNVYKSNCVANGENSKKHLYYSDFYRNLQKFTEILKSRHVRHMGQNVSSNILYYLFSQYCDGSDILINELRVNILTSFSLLHELRVTSYCLLHQLRVPFYIRVTSYCLLHELRVPFYIRVTSYCLLHELQVTFIARVTSYFLLYELRITVYCMSYELIFAYELRVNFYM